MAFLLLAIVLAAQVESVPAFTCTSYAFSKKITVHVSQDFAIVHRIGRRNAKNPPLSAREAIERFHLTFEIP